MPVVDFDAEIEAREGRSVGAIFESEGEEYFRGLERALTEELASAQAAILSPGGGWVTRPATVALIRPRTRLLWLRVTPSTALARMAGNRSARPLLMKGDPAAILARLEAEREAIYSASDAILNTEVLTLQQVTAQAIQLASFWQRGVG